MKVALPFDRATEGADAPYSCTIASRCQELTSVGSSDWSFGILTFMNCPHCHFEMRLYSRAWKETDAPKSKVSESPDGSTLLVIAVLEKMINNGFFRCNALQTNSNSTGKLYPRSGICWSLEMKNWVLSATYTSFRSLM